MSTFASIPYFVEFFCQGYKYIKVPPCRHMNGDFVNCYSFLSDSYALFMETDEITLPVKFADLKVGEEFYFVEKCMFNNRIIVKDTGENGREAYCKDDTNITLWVNETETVLRAKLQLVG